MQMSVSNSGEIQWGWRDRLPIILLAIVAAAVMFGTLSACGPHDSSKVPGPVANAAPVAPTDTDNASVNPGNPDCYRLPDADASLCQKISLFPAYGWTNPDGSKVSNPNGAANVADLLSDSSLSPAEIHAGLVGILTDYTDHTAVTVHMADLPSPDCWFEVGYEEQKEGQPVHHGKITVEPICPDDGLKDQPDTLQAAK